MYGTVRNQLVRSGFSGLRLSPFTAGAAGICLYRSVWDTAVVQVLRCDGAPGCLSYNQNNHEVSNLGVLLIN